MKAFVLYIFVGCTLITPPLLAQTKTSADTVKPATTPPPIPEEARRHFVIGTTLFKEAKTPADYSQVESQFKQAADLAPQWPDARYNLALAKEAAGDYSGAMADLKLYQQFKLSDSEARAAQDKIYVLEAKQQKAVDEANSPAAQSEKLLKNLEGGIWSSDDDRWGGRIAIKIVNHKVQIYFRAYMVKGTPDPNTQFDNDLGYSYWMVSVPFDLRNNLHGHEFDAPIVKSDAQITADVMRHFTISDDSQIIFGYWPGFSGVAAETYKCRRIKQ